MGEKLSGCDGNINVAKAHGLEIKGVNIKKSKACAASRIISLAFTWHLIYKLVPHFVRTKTIIFGINIVWDFSILAEWILILRLIDYVVAGSTFSGNYVEARKNEQ
ncbi:hypothetical protein [Bacillus sp. REN16]|uniref:hypothetical protein n=1 Tax=Bacillus sp. REN16 TaxID=2887296 RepID=UPI001E538AD1|nr:hypothetical protein [Bacillus sp. REN16]MCC3357880.1 hypothetical protein [Bacillus sp. REN16]